MTEKTYVPEGEVAPSSQIRATMEALAATIAARREAGEGSYTYRLLSGSVDDVLKKVMEEAGEVALAAKDVEGWATSSVAAAVALKAAADDAGRTRSRCSFRRNTARRWTTCATRPPMWCIIYWSYWSATASRPTSSPPS